MKQTDKRRSLLWELFVSFFKIGAFTFGGGYAMIPLIQKEMAENKKWITDRELLDIIAIAESTPGPIAINTATFVGTRVCGLFGAIAATLGVVLPSFCIILAIFYLLREFQNYPVVQYAFFGIRAGVLALLVKALWSMAKQCPKNIFSVLVAAAAFVAAGLLKVNVLLCLIGCAVAGLSYTLLLRRKGAQK